MLHTIDMVPHKLPCGGVGYLNSSVYPFKLNCQHCERTVTRETILPECLKFHEQKEMMDILKNGRAPNRLYDFNINITVVKARPRKLNATWTFVKDFVKARIK